MKIQKREQKIFLYIIGVVIVLLVFQFVFSPQMDKNISKQAEVDKLNTSLAQVKALDASKKDYTKKTADMRKEISDTLKEFPADFKAEDGIMYAKELENQVGMTISTVNVSQPVLLYTMGQGAAAGTTQEPANTTGTTGTTGTPAPTGTTTPAGTTDTTGKMDTPASTDVSNPLNGEMLFNSPLKINYTVTYGDMKRCLEYINKGAGKKTIDTISLSYDASTGNIMGDMSINTFSMTGTDAVYNPPSIPSISIGTDNIFGSGMPVTP
ncbi:MAG: hypothetical protein PHX08_08490 [Lachnospiraceae bacterium]|nr:hypothetical protein [Lachnospiraceae bacterium]